MHFKIPSKSSLIASISIARRYIRTSTLVSASKSFNGDSKCDKDKDKSTKCTYKPCAKREIHEDFIRKSIDMLLHDCVFEGTDVKSKITNFVQPEELEKMVDLTLKRTGTTHDELLKLLQHTVKYSVKSGHPHFHNQMFGGLDPYGLVGQFATDALNTTMFTYEITPILILIEEIVLKEMRKILGYPDGNGDGIFCPGGSYSNGMGIATARYKAFPESKMKGNKCLPRLVVFTSEEAHYSVKKFSALLGIGVDNVYVIKSDDRHKMCIESLCSEVQRAKAEDAVPLMVSATAGNTVYGACDPLNEIADLCQKEKMWMHVDAAWGGGALMSKKHRPIIDGIERSDSITWNPHKMLSAPQQCTVFLTRHAGLLEPANESKAAYLFMSDKFYDTKYDTGDKHIQCGRRADVLKFWFMWKAKGTDGFEKHVDRVFEIAELFAKTIKCRPGFEMVLEPHELPNVCFWYVPPSLRDAKGCSDYKERLNKIAPKMKEKMMKEGLMMISYQAVSGHPNFWRICFKNSCLSDKDVIHLADEIERFGKDL